MPEFHGSWQRGDDLGADWFFQTLPRGDTPSNLLLHSLKIGSDFCNSVIEKVQAKGLVPEIVLNSKDFAMASGSEELLHKGVHFTLLFYDSLGPEEIIRLTQIEKFRDQFKFVIVARKDWNVSNTFRSLPHFVRNRLYVDFPVPLHPSDPFLSSKESRQFLSSFEKDFPGYNVKSYCPHLYFYSEGWTSNIKSIDFPDKPSDGTCELTLVCCDRESLNRTAEWLHSSKSLPEKIEILFVSAEGFDHKVVASLNSFRFIPCRVDKVNSSLSVSKTLLKNFAIERSQSERLVFCDGRDVDELEAGFDSGDLMFSKTELQAVGGFDPLIKHGELQKIDFSYRSSVDKGENPDFTIEVKSLTSGADEDRYFSDKDLFFHKHLSFVEQETGPSKAENLKTDKSLEEYYRRIDRRRHYSNLFKQHPKVPLEAIWRMLKMFVLRNSWRLRPTSYKAFWSLRGKLIAFKNLFKLSSYDWYWSVKRFFDPRSYEIYWSLRNFLDLKSYNWYWKARRKLNPITHEWYWAMKAAVNPRTYQVYWGLHKKLNPKTYSWYWVLLEKSVQKYWRLKKSLNPRSHAWYWSTVKFFSKIRHHLVVNLWRVGPRQIYWYTFRVLFPVRKIYYFLNFQYEKRILGLHQKPLPERGGL